MQSSEKVHGMFGTLVICLPSEHTGGTVCLQHGTDRVRFDTSEFSSFGASYLAWYAVNVSYFTDFSSRDF